ncbi:MAG: hypothetical protein U0Q15_17495 [Kineosporiaceae bacterium]
MHVTAILLIRGGADRVARVVSSLQDQTRRPDRVVVVDTTHDPEVGEGLRDLIGPEAHLTWAEPTASTHAAVRAALGACGSAPSGGDVDGAGDAEASQREDEWLWLLTDTGAPSATALESLLAEVETSPSVSVAGCASVAWDDDQQLLDVGTCATRGGARIRGVDLREVPQGQYDERRDVYAVPLPGMLVRRSTYEALEGFDPALRGAREDLDLCRRVHLAGERVVVLPQATTARFLAPPRQRARADRHDAVHLRLVEPALVWWLPVLLWTLLAVPLRAAWRMILKQPGLAAEEALGALGALASPVDVARARRRQRRGRRMRRRLLAPLRPRARQIWWQRREDVTAYRFWSQALADVDDLPRLPSRREPGLPVTSLTDAEAEADVGLVPVRIRSHPPRLAGLAAVALAAVAGVLATRDLLAHPRAALAGPALLPAPERLSALWSSAVTTWRPVGLGRAAAADPWSQVLALLSVPFDGSPRLAVLAVLVLAVPVSAATAWVASGAITRSRLLRPWAALVWASCPVLLAGTRQGRISLLVAHALLPLFALSLARAVGVPRWRAPLQVPSTGVSTALLAAAAARDAQARRPRADLTAASAAALLFVVVVACAPWSAAPLLATSVLVTLVGPVALRMNRRGRTRARWVMAWGGAVVLAAGAPWWWQVVARPRLLLADPAQADAAATGADGGDLPVPGLLDRVTGGQGRLVDLLGGPDGAPARRLAAVLPDGWAPHVPAVLTGVVAASLAVTLLLALAAVAVAGRRRPVAVLAGVTTLLGAATWVVSPHVVLDRSGAAPAGGWAGAGLSLVLLGLLVAALVAADGVRLRVRRRRARWLRGALAVAASGALLAGPVLTLAGWGWTASGEGVHAVQPDVMTVVGAAESEGPAATRTLVLQVDREVHWTILRAPGPRLAQRSSTWALEGGDRRDAGVVTPLLGRLLSDNGADARDDLAALAVGTVMLLPPLDLAAAASLDSTPGLVRVGTEDDQVLSWRVDLDAMKGPTRPTRAWLRSGADVVALTPGSRPDRFRARLDPGPAGRRLVLAEHADPQWRAWVDGRRLPAGTWDGWAQSFEVPAQGGSLVVRHGDPLARRLHQLSWAALVLAALVAVPMPRRRRPPAPPRPSRPVDRAPDEPGPRIRAVSGVAEEEALERWATGSWPVVAEAPQAPDPGEAGAPPERADVDEQAVPAGAPVPLSEDGLDLRPGHSDHERSVR